MGRGLNIWIDIGCDDFAKAARNREMVAKKENISYYLALEYWLDHASHHTQLPDFIIVGGERLPFTAGRLPEVSRSDWRQSGGENIGMREEDSGEQFTITTDAFQGT